MKFERLTDIEGPNRRQTMMFWETYRVYNKDQEIGIYSLIPLGDRVSLWRFSIKEEFRRKGFGEKVMRELIENVKERGFLSFGLIVRKDNLPAQKLYHKLGFRRVSESLPIPGQHSPSWYLQLDFDNKF